MTTETLLRLALETSLRVTALAGLVAVVLLAARVRSSSVRHAAWVAVLVAMVLMPVLPYCVPAVGVPVPAPAMRSVDALTEFVSPFSPPPDLGDVPARITVPSAEEGLVLAPAVPVAAARRPIWPAAVAAIYALGFVLLASRLFVGWRRARRLVENRLRESFSIQNDVESGSSAGKRLPESIFASAHVVTPLTVGVLSPRIILPLGWRTWPAEKLQAVLAHERAHIARHDPLIAFVAALNRCVFWFHPLAWWLERKLSTMAEHACDEATVRELGERRRTAYAEVLLDMAETARQAGGRLTWQGIGVVNGTSPIARRIDRILNGDLLREMSRVRKAVVAVASVAAIFVAVACHQTGPQTQTTAPLKEDPEITARLAVQQAQSEFYKKAWGMSASEIDQLQAQWDKNPEDIEAAKMLLTAYEPIHNGVRVARQEFVVKRRAIILWLITHHPDNYLAARSAWMIGADDDVGRTQAHRLWQVAIAKPDVNVKTLSNAATFFSTVDRALAEQTLLRAQAMEPGGGRWVVDDYLWISGAWTSRLADLYARTLWGSKVSPAGGEREFDQGTFTSGFAQQVRQKLNDTKDVALLGSVAQSLVDWRGRTTGPKPDTPASNPLALAEQYAKRALDLDPNQPMAHSALATLRRYETNQGRVKVLSISFWSGESQAAKLAALSPADRFAVLADLADSAYGSAEYNDFESKRKDAEYPNKWFKTREEREQAAISAWAQSKQFAREALDLAPQFKDAPNYSSTIYRANIVLGLNALREGDVKTAVRGLQVALTAPPSEQLAYDPTGGLDSRLVNYLLKCGERESVADFLEKSATLVLRDRDQRLKDSAAIRKGQMPMSYQYMVTPHEL
jgi:beta-lactamase regulating signal transducer with metallopeptidase domain